MEYGTGMTSTPAPPEPSHYRAHFDPDAFGKFSERIAGVIGSARFLVIQTLLVIIWIAVNVVVIAFRFDPYPFILLNLLFSTQAAYAAPLILLAQSRQAARDRIEADADYANDSETLVLLRDIQATLARSEAAAR